MYQLAESTPADSNMCSASYQSLFVIFDFAVENESSLVFACSGEHV